MDKQEGEKKERAMKDSINVYFETDVIGEAINKAIEQVAIVVKAAEVAQVSHEKWEQLQEVEDGLYNKGSTWDGTLEGEYKAIDDAYEAELEAIEKKRISSMSNPRLLELAELSQSLLELIDKYQTR